MRRGLRRKKRHAADVCEVVTPLTHVRGTVTSIGFDLTVPLQRTARAAKPKRTFINIGGQPWEFRFVGAGRCRSRSKLSGPLLYADQVAAVIRDRVVDEAALASAVAGLCQLPPSAPAFAPVRCWPAFSTSRCRGSLRPWPGSLSSPPSGPAFAAGALAGIHQLPPIDIAVFGKYDINNSGGGLAVTIDPLVAAALRPLNRHRTKCAFTSPVK